MTDEQFDDLAFAVVLGEATPEETAVVEQACRAEPRHARRLEELRREHARAGDLLGASAAARATAAQREIPAPVLEDLMRRVVHPPRVVARRERAWWRTGPLWVAAAAAAAGIVASVLVHERAAPPSDDGVPRSRDLSTGQRGQPPALDPDRVHGLPETAPMPGPQGETAFLDPLIHWPDGPGAVARVTIALVGVGELVQLERTRPPLDFEAALVLAGERPRAGAAYEVAVYPDATDTPAWHWTFTTARDATHFPDDLDDTGLLERAAAAVAAGSRDEAWQCLLRLSAGARLSARAQELEQALAR